MRKAVPVAGFGDRRDKGGRKDIVPVCGLSGAKNRTLRGCILSPLWGFSCYWGCFPGAYALRVCAVSPLRGFWVDCQRQSVFK